MLFVMISSIDFLCNVNTAGFQGYVHPSIYHSFFFFFFSFFLVSLCIVVWVWPLFVCGCSHHLLLH